MSNKRNISWIELRGSELEKYSQSHSGSSLDDYIQSIRDRLDKEDSDEEIRKVNEIQWYKDNLVGKNVLFRLNNGYKVLKIDFDEQWNQPVFKVLYEFSVPDDMHNSDEKGKLYNIRKITSGGVFRKEWIKNPYNKWEYNQRSVYIISDEKLEEIKNLFETFFKGYHELLDFEKSDYVTKVE